MRDIVRINSMYWERYKTYAPLHTKMRDIRDTYNGDIDLPVPELNQNERAAVANLLRSGLDQLAGRTASTTPNIWCPPRRDGFKNSEMDARDRRQAMFAWWAANKMRNKLYRRARWFHGYGFAPAMIRPDFKKKIPLWHLRDPILTYPAPGLDIDEINPPDCIFAFDRSVKWIKEHYPEKAGQICGPKDPPEMMFTMVEYVDDQDLVLIVTAKRRDANLVPEPPAPGMFDSREAGRSIGPCLLEAVSLDFGMCPVIIPGRITLDRIVGKFDNIVAQFKMQAELMALEYLNVKRNVFAEAWLEARAGEEPEIVQEADPITGDVGIVRGGVLKFDRPPPDVAGNQLADRLERSQRIEGGIPAEFGGESTTNIRTGRRGDSVLSAVVDFPVQEAQVQFAEALQEENKIGVAIDKAYFGSEKKSFYVSWKGAAGPITYVANDLWTTDENYVSFAHAGADTNALVVGGGQRIGQGTMSKETFMRMDPLVEDPEKELERIESESLNQALLQSIGQQAAGGQIPPSDVAAIIKNIQKRNVTLADAVSQAHDAAQKRQAAQAPPGAPETQPGIAQPGAGAEAGQAIQGPNASQQGLEGLLNALRRPQRGISTEGQQGQIGSGGVMNTGTP